jgi:hypothetical protein
MKSDEVGTTLKHPETINGNIKNLSKTIKMKDKGNANITINCEHFWSNPFNEKINLACWWGLVSTQ